MDPGLVYSYKSQEKLYVFDLAYFKNPLTDALGPVIQS